MSELLEVLGHLQDTDAAIARLERVAVEQPDVLSLTSALRSLKKRQENLEAQFAHLASNQFLDICRYRLFDDSEGRPTLRAFTSTLGDFQSLFTMVYDALKNGPKKQSQVSAEIAAKTTFGFGYTFAGSLGVVLTLPNQRLLLADSDIDEAIHIVFKMARAKTTEEVAYFAHTLGVAPVRKIYQWALDHVQAGLGVDIQWKREEAVRAELFIQPPELEVLERTIAATSDITEETFFVRGRLLGADVKSRTFHLEFEDGSDIRGKMSEEVASQEEIALKHHYAAKIHKRVKIHYAMEKEDVSYTLLDLAPLKSDLLIDSGSEADSRPPRQAISSEDGE
jgi:hypothetical protein